MENKRNKKRVYSLVFVLATDIKKTKRGSFEFLYKNKKGVLDVGFRLAAAHWLYKTKATPKIILVGGCEEKVKKWRTEVMREHLVKRYGVPENVLEELHCYPGNTCGNAIEIIKYICGNQIWKKKKPIGILTNLYHLPRIMKLLIKMLGDYKRIPIKKKNKIVLEPIAAESIIVKKIKDFYSTKEIGERILNESKGIQAIENGNYPCNW